jgi:hypothetical protein
VTDNELLLMETIHLFVELLDEHFSNVCEVRFYIFDVVISFIILFITTVIDVISVIIIIIYFFFCI